MHSIWSGALSFGLINIPVKLYSGSIERSLNFDMLHKKDLSPIRFARICKLEEKEVPYKDIVKGYEYQKGKYVVITEEDFHKAALANTKLIEIQSFINESEVDKIYYDKPYFLEPEKGAEKVYALLHETLIKSKKVGLGIYIFHTSQHLGLIKPLGKRLILQQLRYKSDIKNIEDIRIPKAQLQKKEIEIALKLVEEMTEHFHIEKFKDPHTEILKKIITYKSKNKKLQKKLPPIKYTHADHLFQQLQKSLKKPRAYVRH